MWPPLEQGARQGWLAEATGYASRRAWLRSLSRRSHWRRRKARPASRGSARLACRYDGVGQLMRIAVEKGRQTRPDIELGICGEHGGDPASIAFCHEIGLDYVSCSPFRVPVARLAAAQAALATAERDK